MAPANFDRVLGLGLANFGGCDLKRAWLDLTLVTVTRLHGASLGATLHE